MAQERTLGYASAPEREGEDPSKEELQRRMDQARDSIASTVTEIKETVASQVEHVKDALDWREHFKKQPVAWSLGALGVGFLTGYGLAAAIKGNSDDADRYEDDLVQSSSYGYAKPLRADYSNAPSTSPAQNGHESEANQGPGLLERFKETSAYDRLSREAGSLGDRFLDELSNTAHTVVLPALLAKIKNWIGVDLSTPQQSSRAAADTGRTGSTTNRPDRGTYEPVLERPT